MKPILVIRHVPHEDLGLLAEVFQQHRLSYGYVDMFHQPPRSFDPGQLAGLVVLGGPMSVHDTKSYPYLCREIDWIGQAADTGLPVLGVCLGAQLLAKSLGARVYPNSVKEIGWCEIELTEDAADDPLFSDCHPTETVFQWHGETFDLPNDSVLLARGAACVNQAFRFGLSAYGLQFHLETTAEMLDRWLTEPGMCSELSTCNAAGAAEIRHGANEQLPAMLQAGRRVFGRFAEICSKRI